VHSLQQWLQPLSDGLLIEKSDDITIEQGRWTILITLQSPSRQYAITEVADLHRSARSMLDTIDMLSNTTDQILSAERRSLWRQRLHLVLSSATDHFAYDRRNKRGLINVGGSLLSMLFGTVTQDELLDVQKQLDNARRKAVVVHHDVTHLVSVVNQSRIATQENRQRINQLTTQLQQFQTDQNRNIGSFNVLQNAVLLDETIALIEAVEHLLYKEMHSLELVQRSLEDGRLAENIFPLTILQDVIREAQGANLVALPKDWYYRNVHISTLLIEDGWFTYSASLPFIGHDSYIRYSLRAWSVPVNGSAMTARLVIQPDIALNTGRGHLFVPQQCEGWNPTVCRSGPVYSEDRWLCERGLITSHRPDTEHCDIHIDTFNRTMIFDVGPGRFIIQVLGEAYTLSCEGRSPVKNELDAGTYLIHLPNGCSLQGNTWILFGEIRQMFSRNFTLNVVHVDRIHLPRLIPQEKLRAYFELHNLSALRGMDMVPGGIDYDHLDVAHHLSWSNIIISIFIIIALLCLTRYVWMRRHNMQTNLKSLLGPRKPQRQKSQCTVTEASVVVPTPEVSSLTVEQAPVAPRSNTAPFTYST
jgi:hypothetical protein